MAVSVNTLSFPSLANPRPTTTMLYRFSGKAGLSDYETDPSKSRDEQHPDWHVSRNEFEEVTSGSRAILAVAIDKHKDMKEATYA